MDKSKERCYVFKPDQEHLIINISNLEEFIEKGWETSPHEFVDLKSAGIDPENELLVHEVGSSIQGVTDSINGALNLALMSKGELVQFANKHYGKRLKLWEKRSYLLKECKILSGHNLSIN